MILKEYHLLNRVNTIPVNDIKVKKSSATLDIGDSFTPNVTVLLIMPHIMIMQIIAMIQVYLNRMMMVHLRQFRVEVLQLRLVVMEKQHILMFRLTNFLLKRLLLNKTSIQEL